MPLDYLSWLPVVLRYVDTREGWYIRNWLYYSLQTKNFPLFWSHSWKYDIQANDKLTKVKEKLSIIKFDVFVRSFIFFVPMSQTISVINISGACYFLHTSNSWCVCWRVHVRSHASNGEGYSMSYPFSQSNCMNM